MLAISTGMTAMARFAFPSAHQAQAASLLTREQAENIPAQSIQITSESPDMPLSKIKEYFPFSVLSSRGTTTYCGAIRRPTWVIGISPDKRRDGQETEVPGMEATVSDRRHD